MADTYCVLAWHQLQIQPDGIAKICCNDAGAGADGEAASVYRRRVDEIWNGARLRGIRRAMVERLTRGPASTSELGRPLAMTLSAVGQHLKVLEASGLVTTEKRGRERVCRVEPSALSTAEGWISRRRAMLEQRLDRLAAHLGEAPTRRRSR